MRKENILPLVLMSILSMLLIQGCGPTPEEETTDLSMEEVALEIIESSGPCTLITLDSAGQPRARIMDPFTPEKNFVIWFGTNTKSRKVEEIIANSRATINYYDKPGAAYVSLYGRAEIIENESIKQQYWKPAWEAFYPNYPEGYCLIKFIPNYLELISEKHGITGDPVTWKPSTISLQ